MAQHAKKQLYIRLKKQLNVASGQLLTLRDVAETVAPDNLLDVLDLPVFRVPNNAHLIVLNAIDVVKCIYRKYPNVCIHLVGNPDLIITIDHKNRVASPIWLAFVWMLLFIGSGLAIMNFHADVNMQEVHQRIYFLITGNQSERPLWLQIPYAFGIGLGMVLFFNHVFQRRFNKEPSPLEVEMYLYQEHIDQYVIDRERNRNVVRD